MKGDLIKLGSDKGYIKIFKKNETSLIRYTHAGKEYNFQDPEEHVRAEVYVELIEEYQYLPSKIRFEETPPVREGARPSDIVIYDKDDFPFIVIELKKEEANQNEIETGIRELFGNANLFGVRWALFDCRRERKAYFSLKNFSLAKESVLRKSDIPKDYGQPTRFVYGNGVGLPLAPIKDILYFQRIMKRCHDVLRDNENLSPTSAFPIINRIIYTKQFDETNTPSESYYSFQISSDDAALSLSDRIASLYKKAVGVEPDVFEPFLGVEKPETLLEIVNLLQRFSLKDTHYDIKGEAYQSFLGKIMRGAQGQYFTPRQVVKPVVEILEPGENEKIIDPCCGTGGFLIHTYNHLRKRIADKYKHDDNTLIRKQYDIAHYNIYGLEVDPSVAESCIAGMLLEEDAHGHIVVTSALSDWNDLSFLKKGIEKGKFQVLMTNPPFGKKTRIENVSNKFALASEFKIPPFEVLILERAIQLLDRGGRCGFVIPDINLTNEKVIKFLLDNTIILGVVSLTSDTFKPYGSNAKTSVIFFEKKRRYEDKTEKVFMAKVYEIGYDATGRTKGENCFEKIIPFFHKFLRQERIDLVKEDGFIVMERDFSDELRTNLRVESYCYNIREKENVVPLKEVAEVLRGYTPGWHAYTKKGIPILKVRNLKNRFIDYSFEKRGHVSENMSRAHPVAHVKKFDILLTASAHSPEYIAKKIDIVDVMPSDRCMVVSELLIIRPNLQKINPFYLLSVLRLPEINEQFRACIKGTTAHIYPGDVRDQIYVPVITREEQEKIGKSLEKALIDFRQFEKEYKKHAQLLKDVLESD